MRASNSSRVSTFLSLFNHTNKNLKELGLRFKQLYLGKHSELDTCSYELFSPNERWYLLTNYVSLFLNHTVCAPSALTLKAAICLRFLLVTVIDSVIYCQVVNELLCRCY